MAANFYRCPHCRALEARIEEALKEHQRKAWDALARYKFWMFGYHCGQWVQLNRILGGRRSNPFGVLVKMARQVRDSGGVDASQPCELVDSRDGEPSGQVTSAGDGHGRGDSPRHSGESVPAPALDHSDAWSDTYSRADRDDEIAERQIRRERH